MIDATVQHVGDNWDGVSRLIEQARKHEKSAERVADDPESAYLLYYSAAHKAIAAALLADGDRVSVAERGHVILIEAVKQRIGEEHAAAFTRIDRARRKRNRVAYESEEVTAGELTSIARNVAEVLAACAAYIENRRPEGSQ